MREMQKRHGETPMAEMISACLRVAAREASSSPSDGRRTKQRVIAIIEAAKIPQNCGEGGGGGHFNCATATAPHFSSRQRRAQQAVGQHFKERTRIAKTANYIYISTQFEIL